VKYLLDTDVFSAITEGKPNADEQRVQDWFTGLDGGDFGIPVLSLYERQWGIDQLIKQGSPYAPTIKTALDEILQAYPEAFVEIDADATLIWPAMVMKTGKDKFMDAGILACANSRKLIVATRNYKDFKMKGVCLINPFKVGLDPHDGVNP
jgi:predicted nucleic acid-binding protein